MVDQTEVEIGEITKANRGSVTFTHPDSYSDTLSINGYTGGIPKENITQEELLAIAHSALDVIRTKGRTGYNNNYGMIYSDGTFDLYPGQVCMGALNCTQRICADKPVAFFITYYNTLKQVVSGCRQDAYTYLDWLANRSPFTPCFITKDPKEIIEQGVIWNTERNITEIISAVLCVRMMRYRDKLEMFIKLREKLPENIAFCLAQYFIKSATYSDHYKFSTVSAWHDIFARTLSPEAIKRFGEADMSGFETIPMRDKPYRYGDFTSPWKKKDEQPIKITGGITKSIRNSFGTSHNVDGLFAFENLEQDSAKFLEQIGWTNAASV